MARRSSIHTGLQIRILSDADVDAHVHRLTALMTDVVDDGASIGFHPPLANADAEAYWRSVQLAMRSGDRVMLGAFDVSGALIGTGQLALEPRQNGRHRAEVQKLIVAPAARRRGVARALMAALEQAALAAGRTLLVLDTREGDAAAQLYHALGWQFAGRVPGYVLERDGTTSATLIFYRTLTKP